MAEIRNELNLLAAMGSLALGAGVLWHGPGRKLNRIFAFLCAAITIWNFGLLGSRSSWLPQLPWTQIYLLGACGLAPIGLHMALVVAHRSGWAQRWGLRFAYAVATGVWLGTWLPGFETWRGTWSLAAATCSIVMFATAIVLLYREISGRRPGAQRKAYRLLLIGGAVAIVGGLLDYLPRDWFPFPKLGFVFVLLFLVLLAGVLVRHRFLDINVFLARATVLLGGGLVATSITLLIVNSFSRPRLVLFVAHLLVLALAGWLGYRLTASEGGPFMMRKPVARTLMAISRTLPSATRADEVWTIIEQGLMRLAGRLEASLYRCHESGTVFCPTSGLSGGSTAPSLSTDSALARLLTTEDPPILRLVLEEWEREQDSEIRARATAVLEDLDRLEIDMVVPLRVNGRLVGWLGARGRRGGLTANVAAAFLAVGNQAGASLERIAATEKAKLSETLAALGELSAGLAHEIRNPVAAIQGAAQALGPDVGNMRGELLREMLDVITEESGRLERVVQEFLEYARPSRPRTEPVDLADLAGRVVRSFEIAGTNMKTEIGVADGTPKVMGDRDQLHRVFENLVRNAGEAAGAEGRLRVDIAPDTEGRVVARFEDNGPGISPDDVSRLFRPFHTTKAGGTGLGLALAHRTVEAHGGEIRVDGRPGRGARFEVILPAAQVEGVGSPESTEGKE